jgi:hypothetical protein
MKTKFTLLFVILLQISCSSPKFYKEVRSLYHNKSTIVLSSKDDRNRVILKDLESNLTNSNHILYYAQPDFSTSTGNLTTILYDVENKFYFHIKVENSKIIIDTIPNSRYSEYQLDNISLYIKGNSEKLIALGNTCNYSGVQVYDNIYEINLSKRTKNKLRFKNYFYCKDNIIDK